jgi:hypothetical protein
MIVTLIYIILYTGQPQHVACWTSEQQGQCLNLHLDLSQFSTTRPIITPDTGFIITFVCLGYIAAVDSVSPTVFVIDPESSTGELVRWFDCSDYMREPSDITIRGMEYYVCDFKV